MSNASEMISQAVVAGALEVLLRVTVVLCFLCLFGLCLKKQSAAFRHGFWLLVLFAVLSTPFAGSVFPGWGPENPFSVSIIESESTSLSPSSSVDATLNRAIPAAQWPEAAETETPVFVDRSDRPLPVREFSFAATESESDAVAVADAQPVVAAAHETFQSGFLWPVIVLMIWALGCMAMLVHFVTGIGRVTLLLRRATHVTDDEWLQDLAASRQQLGVYRNVRLKCSRDASGPATGGILRPFVVLPAGCQVWSAERRKVVLLHELAHIRRWDVLTLWLARLITSVFWFHPLVWFVVGRLQQDCEKSCDDLVLSMGTVPSSYSQHLVEIAVRHRSPGWIGTASLTIARANQLEERICSVLDEQTNRKAVTVRSVSGLALLVLSFSTVVATAGRVVVRDQSGRVVATVEIPDGGSVSIDGDSAVLLNGQQRPDLKPQLKGLQDWSQWGGDSGRNNVSVAKRLATTWDVRTGKNIHWDADLGSQTYGTPVVANNKVFVGTNNGRGYNDRFPANVDLGCLLCFDQSTGRFLWQHSSKKLATGRANDWPEQGVASTPVVVGDRLYYVSNRAVVTCLDTEGFLDESDDSQSGATAHDVSDEADVVWEYDLIRELNVFPRAVSGCAPTTDGKRLFLITSNGVGQSGANPPSPNAPAFVCLDLQTGKLLWTATSHFPARDCQLSGPSIGVFNGRTQVLFPGGDGWVYAFDPEGNRGRGQLLWKFDCNPKDADFQIQGTGRKNLSVSTPVIHNQRVYVATGRNPEQGEGEADLWCIDPSGHVGGEDISESLVYDRNGRSVARVHTNFVPGQRDTQEPNPSSGVVWHYTGQDMNGDGKTDFEETFHRTWSAPAIHNGLIVVNDMAGLVHCLDESSGRVHWIHDCFAASWSSPMIADGRIYVTDEDGVVTILKLGSKLEVIATNETLDSAVYSSPVAVGETLFVASNRKLIAINQGNTSAVSRSSSHATPASQGPAAVTDTIAESTGWSLPDREGWSSKATAKGDRVYAGSLDGVLHCLELQSGNEFWRYASSGIQEPPAFMTEPVVTSNSVLAADEDGVIHAVDAMSGEKQWTFETHAEPGGIAALHDRVVVTSHNANVYCLDSGGKLLWTLATDDRINAAAVILRDQVLVAGCDRFLRVLDIQTGGEIRRVSLESYVPATPAVLGELAFFGTHGGDIVGVNWVTGETIWTNNTSGFPFVANAAVGQIPDGKTGVFVGSHDKTLYHLNTKGTRVWTFRTRGRINSSAAVGKRNLYFGSNDGNVYGLDLMTGEQQWKLNTGSPVTAGVELCNGYLIFGEASANGRLRCVPVAD